MLDAAKSVWTSNSFTVYWCFTGREIGCGILKVSHGGPLAGQHENSKLSNDATCGRTWRVPFRRTFLRLWRCGSCMADWKKSAGEFAEKVLEDFSSSVPASCWSLAISYLLFCTVIVGISYISTPLDPGQCSQRCYGRDPEKDHSQDVRPKMPVVCFWPWKICSVGKKRRPSWMRLA